MDARQSDWKELRDTTGRYQGRINVRTLTLILVGRQCDTKHELAPLIEPSLKELQSGSLQAYENMLE